MARPIARLVFAVLLAFLGWGNRSTFDGALITGADFRDAILDKAQIRELCQRASGVNIQTGMAKRASLGYV